MQCWDEESMAASGNGLAASCAKACGDKPFSLQRVYTLNHKTAAGDKLRGTMEVITIGDAFPDSEVVVVQVLADKVVAEEVVGGDKKVRQQVWVYKAENAASGSRVERLLLSLPQDATLVPNTINTHVLESNSQEVVQ